MPTSPRVFVFAGGGTGGHIYPALAIAEQVRERDPGARCRFLCSTRPLDSEILRAENVEFTPISAAPFGAHPKRLAKFALSWPGAVRESREAIVETLRGAEARSAWLVSLGGFVCPPAASAARRVGMRTALVNLDAVPGKASRLLAKRSDLVFSPDGPTVPTEWKRIRPVVRRAAMPNDPPSVCRGRLGLKPDAPTLFVTGASQGARTINQLMAALVEKHAEALRGWQVFHQCGAGAEKMLIDAYQRAGVAAVVVPFCQQMADAWGAAELAVSRCGAGSVGEAWASRTPCVFMPYPFHKDQHQRANASPMADAGGAIIETDHIDADENLRHAGTSLIRLLGDEHARSSMRTAIASLGAPDGAFSVVSSLFA